MKIAGHTATRVHGSLVVELADGRQGSLEIDIDVSDPRSFMAIRDHYDEETNEPDPAMVSQTLEFHWAAPAYRRDAKVEPLIIRVPGP